MLRRVREHFAINKVMKKLVFVGFSVILSLHVHSQDTAIKRAEECFINILGQKLFSKLNTAILPDSPFKKIYYYSYQVFENDSVKWISYNYDSNLTDSIANAAFKEAVDSTRKKGLLELLKNDAKTFVPLYVFYKTHLKDPYDDKISIVPTETVFGWGLDEKLQPEPVYRITKPFIFKLPKSKPYY